MTNEQIESIRNGTKDEKAKGRLIFEKYAASLVLQEKAAMFLPSEKGELVDRLREASVIAEALGYANPEYFERVADDLERREMP